MTERLRLLKLLGPPMLPTETNPPLILAVVEPLVEACWLVVESGAWLVNLLRVLINFGISFF